jgi:hypothetical protein
VDRDSLGSRELAEDRGGDRIGLVGFPRFPDRGDVIDVDGETHGGSMKAKGRKQKGKRGNPVPAGRN